MKTPLDAPTVAQLRAMVDGIERQARADDLANVLPNLAHLRARLDTLAAGSRTPDDDRNEPYDSRCGEKGPPTRVPDGPLLRPRCVLTVERPVGRDEAAEVTAELDRLGVPSPDDERLHHRVLRALLLRYEAGLQAGRGGDGADPPGMTVNGDVLADVVERALPRVFSDDAVREITERVLDRAAGAGMTVLHGPDGAPRAAGAVARPLAPEQADSGIVP